MQNLFQSKNGALQWSDQPLLLSNTKIRKENILRYTPGATHYAKARINDQPISAFELFVTPEITEIIVKMTNIEGNRVFGVNWKNIDDTDMKAFFGMLLLMGVYRSNNESLDEIFEENNRAEYRATFSQRNFQNILRFIRFDDKSDRAERRQRDKLTPIR